MRPTGISATRAACSFVACSHCPHSAAPFLAALFLISPLGTATSVGADERAPDVETFYQRVDIQRRPRFAVQGVNVAQQIHYRILSTFEVHAADEKGNRKAVQTITDATLVEADPLSRLVFTESLAEMPGRKLTYTINRFAEVVSMQGHRNNTKVVNVGQPQSKGMLVSNVIDEDGWRELAQLTLFQPPQTGRSQRSFVRKTTHDWGSLGSWYGKTNFTGKADGRNRKRFRYQHQLEYIPPQENADQENGNKANDDLPFSIDSAEFRAYEAWGEIRYDSKHQRVTSVREVFHARGTVATSVLGIPSTIDVDEKQIFTISVTGQRLLKFDSASGREPNSAATNEN